MFDSSWYEVCWWHKQIYLVWPVDEKAFMPSVSGHKYLELNLLDFRLISEANLSIDIFPQRCSRILIKCWVVYQSSKSIVLEILSASLLYSRPTQKTSKCMLWLKVRLKMFKAKLWICVLLLPHFIISCVGYNSVGGCRISENTWTKK